MGDFFELLAGAAEALGIGEMVKEATGGVLSSMTGIPDAYGNDDDDVRIIYERTLTRTRELTINDR